MEASHASRFDIEGNVLHVADIDLLTGTPIIDIKPYIPMVDSFFGVSVGWLQGIELQSVEGPAVLEEDDEG